jgi:hypothetical protein
VRSRSAVRKPTDNLDRGGGKSSMKLLALPNNLLMHPAVPAAAWTAIAAVSVYAYFFIQISVNTFIKSDGYYWIAYVIKPFIENGFSWEQIWYIRRSGDHLQPLTKALYLANTRYFDLDLKLFGAIGYFCLLGTTILFFAHFVTHHRQRIAQSVHAEWLAVVFFILLHFVFFNYNATVHYGYALIMVNTLYSVFIPAVFIVLFDRYLIGKSTRLIWVAVSALMVAGVGNTNLLYLLTAICTSAAVLIMQFYDSAVRRRAVKVTLILIAVVALQKMAMAVLAQPVGRFHDGISSLQSNVIVYGKALILALGTTVITPQQLAMVFGIKNNTDILLAIGTVFLALVLMIYFIYFSTDGFKRSTIPIFFFTLYFATVVGIILKRGPTFGETCTLFPRYVKNYNLIYVGLLWICMSFIADPKRDWRRTFSMIVATVFLLVNLAFLTSSMLQSKYVVKANRSVRAIIENAVGGHPETISSLPVWAKPAGWKDHDLIAVQQFLKTHHLTFFGDRQ